MSCRGGLKYYRMLHGKASSREQPMNDEGVFGSKKAKNEFGSHAGFGELKNTFGSHAGFGSRAGFGNKKVENEFGNNVGFGNKKVENEFGTQAGFGEVKDTFGYPSKPRFDKVRSGSNLQPVQSDKEKTFGSRPQSTKFGNKEAKEDSANGFGGHKVKKPSVFDKLYPSRHTRFSSESSEDFSAPPVNFGSCPVQTEKTFAPKAKEPIHAEFSSGEFDTSTRIKDVAPKSSPAKQDVPPADVVKKLRVEELIEALTRGAKINIEFDPETTLVQIVNKEGRGFCIIYSPNIQSTLRLQLEK